MPEASWPAWSLDAVLRDRPAIRVNQLGYAPDGPKQATWVTDRIEPAAFSVQAADGAVLLRGTTKPWPDRPEPTSGMAVHVLDFSAARARPDQCRIVAGDGASRPFRIASRLYEPLARDALGLFYLLRSGCPVEDHRAPGYGRPAGHIGQPPNRGDTAVAGWTGPDARRLYPDWQPSGTVDVSGGWYDAGDYGKYVVSGGIALWQLLRLAELTGAAEALEECRWQLDWMLRMQVPAGQQYASMAFHRVHGTEWSPLPGLAHEDPTLRVLHRPSTAATLHLAAAAAYGARLFTACDPRYTERLLFAAETAYRAAHAEPRLIAPDDEGRYGGGPYGDAELGDDFYWAAAELWLTTGEQQFLDRVTASPWHTRDVFDPAGFDFDRVAAPARLDLAQRRPECRASVLTAADALLDLQQRHPWGQPYAPEQGWDWGSNGRVLNNLVVLAEAHRLSADPHYGAGVAVGMDYLLGRNALGHCYVTGYGTDGTRHLRTRQFGHDLDTRLPPPPPGALAGGANSRPTPGFPSDPRLTGLAPQLCYLDEPTSETTNDICIRWNAPLAFVAAYLDRAAR
jgi:endoglucanase